MRGRRDRGASAVEFALVAPVLFLLLFGIVDYGLWFADSITIRQGAASGARYGSQLPSDTTKWPSWPTGASCDSVAWNPSTTSPQIKALGCAILAGVRPLSGKVYVKIAMLDPKTLTEDSPSPASWSAGEALRVCLLQAHGSITGFIPLPSDTITARADMPIESSVSNLTAGAQELPSGLSWDC